LSLHDALPIFASRKHEEDHLAPRSDSLGAGLNQYADTLSRRRVLGDCVVTSHLVSCADQACRHRRAHVPQPNGSDRTVRGAGGRKPHIVQFVVAPITRQSAPLLGRATCPRMVTKSGCSFVEIWSRGIGSSTMTSSSSVAGGFDRTSTRSAR